MAIAGRKPTPTALKVLHGNPGRRPLNAAEPRAEVARLHCPEELDEIARAEWQRVMPLLAAAGVLTRLDRAALISYCVIYSRAMQADAMLAKAGMVITTANGTEVQSPWVSISNRAHELLNRYEVEFGMTPSSRSRVKVPQKAGEDEFSQFLAKKAGGD